jgi:hypothetical protein
MNPLFAKAVIPLASIVMVVIRAPHGRRSRTVPVAKSRTAHTDLDTNWSITLQVRQKHQLVTHGV